jgi:CubicO group peptidase (beta-lactamase class C family)
MRTATTAVLLAFGLRAQEPAPATARFDFTTTWQEVATEFRQGCQQAGVVGASLWFVRGNEVLGREAFGLADRDGKRSVDQDTNFHWASITKTFTGIAAMQLRDRKKLRLEQPILDLVPELREVHDPLGKLGTVTLRHLLSHSAGFRGPTWPWGGDKPWHPHEPRHFSQLVAMMPYTELEFVPGTRFSYSNPGIVFVGRAIEQLSGDDYEVYMDKNVLRPLGMSRSYFDVTPYHLQRYRSHSYEKKGNESTDLGPDFDTGITVSNGGLNAPLGDMARYLAFLLGAAEAGSDQAQVLARASLEEMWQPVVPTSASGSEQMGLTFFLSTQQGQKFVSHTGGQRSFVTFFYVHPASGTGALGAFNTSTAGPVMARTRTSCMQKLSLPMTKG